MATDKAKGFIEKGLSSKDEGVFIPMNKRTETRPEYLHMSKEAVLKDVAERKAKDAKIKAYAETLNAPKNEALEEPEVQEESMVKKAAKKKKQ